VLANALIAGVGAVGGELTREQRDALVDALRLLDGVLERWPTCLEARHGSVIALLGRGESGGAVCQGHLAWLLANAGPDDVRRPTWQALSRKG